MPLGLKQITLGNNTSSGGVIRWERMRYNIDFFLHIMIAARVDH